ncbi:GTPase ObgE [Thermodesulforhabdus norvegica]|uniref:GTPase Obg n=1 Tax=Thermodesulforhabdus norvegica TaxID=39841 RepID=A0A1I4UAF4_9BACT|nr:GTPase ObgE [Thermodesulforhabdus norvegica]SFM85934.1 GTP-binding protein [Thermodesulforhabdus norvegica]
MKFVDEVRIRLKAGDGGRGCVSFRREKYVPRGGPDGGDGGRGGHIFLEATERKQTLLDFHYKHFFRAPSGQHGRGKDQHGRSGEDVTLLVPLGTVVRDAETGEVLADLKSDGQRWLAVRGGRGGRGNARFASPTNQVPRFAEEGEPGEEREFILELKLLADVGLVGLPNAGKSTLIRAISAARPRVADYPFTTLVPQLGVVRYGDAEPFVVADIPGLIKGAHEGAGLGIRFLKHIERTRVIVHLIDMSALDISDPLKPYHEIRHELRAFSPLLEKKAEIVALNKADLVDDEEIVSYLVKSYEEVLGRPVVVISGLKKYNIDELLRRVVVLLEQTKLQDKSGDEQIGFGVS